MEFIKYSAIILVSALLVSIEYLIAGIIADSVLDKSEPPVYRPDDTASDSVNAAAATESADTTDATGYISADSPVSSHEADTEEVLNYMENAGSDAENNDAETELPAESAVHEETAEIIPGIDLNAEGIPDDDSADYIAEDAVLPAEENADAAIEADAEDAGFAETDAANTEASEAAGETPVSPFAAARIYAQENAVKDDFSYNMPTYEEEEAAALVDVPAFEDNSEEEDACISLPENRVEMQILEEKEEEYDEPSVITMNFSSPEKPRLVVLDNPTVDDVPETPAYSASDAAIDAAASDAEYPAPEAADEAARDAAVSEMNEDSALNEDDFAQDDLYSEDEEAFMNNPFEEPGAVYAEPVVENATDDEIAFDMPAFADDAEEDDSDEENPASVFDSSSNVNDSNSYNPSEVSYAVPETAVSAPKDPNFDTRKYDIPSDGLLNSFENNPYWIIDEETRQAGAVLKETLSEFRIEAEITGIRKGPVITMFELLPAPGVKLNRIVALQDNIALRLAAQSVRIVAPIPGKHAVGIEVPNKERNMVSFRELIEKDIPAYSKMQIPVVLGKDIAGDAQLLDLAATPHLLIAGSTGSGKSVCVNSMILSILYKRSPQEVKMILIDPKIVELKLYNDIPHLLTPVITEPKKAFQALQYCLCEMERRYAMLDHMGVRDIKTYNRRIAERKIMQEKLPYIVVIIDEFADLMATTGKELESTVARLAAMSRAVGIHLVLATQRPSIDVITGLIKANIPSRIAFMVASKTDSRIIIDQVGAEKLLGKGDMLYASAVDPFPVRIQGTFVTEDEVEKVVNYVKQYGEPEYIDDEIFVEEEDDELEAPIYGDGEDPLYDQALEIIVQSGKASASYLQRRLKIGYNRAARLVEEMEERGIVGPANGSKPRELIHIP